MKKISAALVLSAMLVAQNAFAQSMGAQNMSLSVMSPSAMTTTANENTSLNVMNSGNMMMGGHSMTVTAYALNVRARASVYGKRLGHLKRGNTVMVQTKVGNWCQIDYKSANAYVACRYLK